MTEDQEIWSGWVTALREKGLHEPVAWLIKAGKPAAILLSQMITMAYPLFSDRNSYQKMALITSILEDGDQLEAFSQALENNGGDA